MSFMKTQSTSNIPNHLQPSHQYLKESFFLNSLFILATPRNCPLPRTLEVINKVLMNPEYIDLGPENQEYLLPLTKGLRKRDVILVGTRPNAIFNGLWEAIMRDFNKERKGLCGCRRRSSTSTRRSQRS